MFRDKYAYHYKEWLYELKDGFNILLYGVGSKIDIIEDFCKTTLGCVSPYIIINGYELQTSTRSVANAIANLLSIPIKGTTTEFIKSLPKHIAILDATTKKEEYYIAVNSLDSSFMQSDTIIDLLAKAARSERVHIIASVDKIKCALMWDEEVSGMKGFNWGWHHTPTFLPYGVESSQEVDFDETVNEIECELSGTYRDAKAGMPFQDLLRVCREEFYVSNDASLRTHLREFIDHGILKIKFDEIGVEKIYVCLPKEVIIDCLEQHLEGYG